MSKVIEIQWERLVENGKTCPRCSETEIEIEEAIKIAQSLLAPKGIEIKLSKTALTQSEFSENPLKSNRILINQTPLEEIINAKVGESPCCDVCGPVNCRTVETENNSYETIPRSLIISALLKVASNLSH